MYVKELIGYDYKGAKSDLSSWRKEHKCRDNSTDLTRWVLQNGLVDDQIAAAVGCTRPYFNKVRNGMVTPNLTLALKIWDYTRREVPIEQLLPREFRPLMKGVTPSVVGRRDPIPVKKAKAPKGIKIKAAA